MACNTLTMSARGGSCARSVAGVATSYIKEFSPYSKHDTTKANYVEFKLKKGAALANDSVQSSATGGAFIMPHVELDLHGVVTGDDERFLALIQKPYVVIVLEDNDGNQLEYGAQNGLTAVNSDGRQTGKALDDFKGTKLIFEGSEPTFAPSIILV